MSSHSSRRSRRSRKLRSTHLRTKVVALLVSLSALWAFAAFVTLREGLNLLWVSTLTERVGRPTEALLAELQRERRVSVVYLATTTDRISQRAALADQRQKTDAALATFRRLSTGSPVSWAASGALETRIAELSKLLDGLPAQREALDRGSGSPSEHFTRQIEAGFRVYGSISALDDADIAKQSRTLVALSRARETLSQEDALLAGILAAGRFGGSEYAQFVKLVGVQRFAYAEAAAELPGPEREQYERLVAGDSLTSLREIEDRVIESGHSGSSPAVTPLAWTTATEAAAGELRALELAAADLTLRRATPAAIAVVIRLLLAGVLGMFAVIASIVISVTTARALVRQLVRLRDAAHELAHERLPGVVEQLRKGEPVDLKVQAPPLEFGRDEIGQVGHAFNAVQETAVRVAVEQADLRRSVRDVFVSLARRTQTLVHRQLKLLDTMERNETNADELAVLFRVDHLATRMRRNAENLIVLSGASPGRAWRQPVAMVDVVRGAAAEIEDYTRVTVLPIPPAALAGRAVGDVIHLLAELIENAASFSPPQTSVQVSGQMVANGFVVEIEDRGLGMSDRALVDANQQLRKPPEFNLTSTVRLGLFVVGRLAERHDIRVHLRGSPYGGTTAIVLIPSSLVVEDAETQPALPERVNGGSPRRNPGAWPPVRPAPAPPEELSTVFGLPRRMRPANRPPSGPKNRTPEEVRALMSSYQSGTQRARSETAQVNHDQP